MAFPVAQGWLGTNGTTATANAAVSLPGSIVAGETLIVFHRSAVGTAAHGYPSGWTVLVNDNSDGSDDRISCAWRKADGTEGASITVTQTSSKFASVAFRINTAADPTVTPPQISAVATGASATPDPSSLSPTGGAKDYLWLWLGGWEGEQTDPPTGAPTNYTATVSANSGVAGQIATNCRVAAARRSLNAASEDPPSWTISVSDDWAAFVVAVHPAPPGGAVLEGTSLLAIDVAGTIITGIPIFGVTPLVVTSAGVLLTGIPLFGSTDLVITTAGDLLTGIPLIGTSALVITTAGELVTGIPLFGTADLVILTEGSILGPAAALVGAADLVIGVSGNLLTAIQLAGLSDLALITAGGITTGIPLFGTADLILATAGELFSPPPENPPGISMFRGGISEAFVSHYERQQKERKKRNKLRWALWLKEEQRLLELDAFDVEEIRRFVAELTRKGLI